MEKMHLKYGIPKEDAKTLYYVIENSCMKNYSNEDIIIVNSMGMGIFDIAIATYYFNERLKQSIGQKLKYN